MSYTYNILILFTIIFMATTPLKAKTIQEVLAEQNKVVTPVATPSPVVSPTAQTNQDILAANKAKVAERASATPTVSKTINIPTTPEVDLWGWPAYVTTQFPWQVFASQSGMEQAQRTWVVAPWSTLTRSWTVSSPTINNIKAPYVPKIESPATVPKVQTGKLVSDFNSTLKTTGSDKDAYYAGINYAWLTDKDKKRADTLFDMRQKVVKKQPVSTTPPVVPETNFFDTYKSQIEEGTKKSKDITEQWKKDQIEWVTSKKDIMTTEYDAEITGYEDEQNKFEAKQNELLSGYESNRLNQVQWDIRRALLSRGVDISKIPQEQLIALSGEIGSKAFSDIFAAKERATAAIENARQAKIARVNQLRMNKAITDSQYKTDIANINSVADQAKLNADMKWAEVVFGIQQAKKADVTSTDATTAQNRASILSTAWFTNETTTPEVLAIFDSSSTIWDAYNKLKRYIAGNPELAKKLDTQLKSSGGWSLSDQLGLLNYQLNVSKAQQDAVNDAYNRELKLAETITDVKARDAAIQAVIKNYPWTANPTPVSGGA